MNQTFVNQANRAFLVSFLNGRTGISCASSSWLARPFCGTPSPEAPGHTLRYGYPQAKVPMAENNQADTRKTNNPKANETLYLARPTGK